MYASRQIIVRLMLVVSVITSAVLVPYVANSSPLSTDVLQGNGPKSKEFRVLPDQAAQAAHDAVDLAIGAGAVSEPITISITSLSHEELPPLDQGMTNVTQGARRGYRFLPHMQFNNNLSVRMPYNPKLIPAGMTYQDVRTFYYDEETGSWRALERVEIDTNDNTVTSVTSHFTNMINATVTVPDHPGATSYAPNNLKEMGAANPAEGINLIDFPQANNQGSARLSYPIEVPRGRGTMQPQLSLMYDSNGGNGWLGQGWAISVPAVQIDTRWGVPRYDAANETETYLLNDAQLTPLAHRGALQPRTANKTFHLRSESTFQRIVRHGNHPSNYAWEVVDKEGVHFFYGGTAGSVLTDEAGNIFRWALREVRDLNGNGMVYTYTKVQDSGTAQVGVPGTQIYLASINYTQSNGAPGPYTVSFLRDRQQPGFVRRNDVQIDARGGFKMVTADLLKQIEVRFNGDLVRQYNLTYQEGAFHTTLLQSVAQLGEDGSLFNSHSFTYYDDIRDPNGAYQGFNTPGEWLTGEGDTVGANLLGLGIADVQASALGGALNDNLGTHLYVGFNGGSPTKQFSVGGKVGGQDGESEGILALIDLNGDALPDKVFKQGNSIYFRMNESGPGGGTSFSTNAQLLPTLPAIARESSSTTSYGAESYVGVSVIFNTSETFNSSTAYFSDVNGDGLPDMVMGGTVYFNHLDNNNVPTFVPGDSNDTPAPIAGGTVDANGIVQDYSALYEQAVDNFPLHDTLRRWTAPFNGTINITGDVALIEDTGPMRAQYDAADGVRVAIQQNGTELWSSVIGATDYTAKTPAGVNAVAVQAGDRIYFRVGSVFDGAYDQVNWDPRIEYTSLASGSLASNSDANNLNPLVYQASQDFVMAGRRDIFVQMPLDGTVRLAGDLSKMGITSDDITLQVYKNNGLIHSQTQAWNATGALPLLMDIPVVAQDTIRLRVQVDSAIDIQQIVWAPELYYISAPSVAVLFDQAGDPIFRLNPPFDLDLYPTSDLDSPQTPWTASTSGTVSVQADLTATANANGLVVFTAKSNGGLLAKETLTIVNGVVSGGPFNVTVNGGDPVFFDFSVYDPDLGTKVSNPAVTVTPPGGTPIPAPSALYTAYAQGVFAQSYRGWSSAGYNGNRAFANQAIDESRLSQSFDNNATYDPTSATAYLFNPFPVDSLWRGPDDGGWVDGTRMSSARLGPDALSVPDPADFAGARAVVRLGRTQQDAAELGVSILSGSVSGIDPLRGASYSEVDYLDMNGDRYPDVLGNGRIQYSTADGGLEQTSRTVAGLGYVRESDANSYNVGVGGSATLFKAGASGVVDDAGHSTPKQNTTGSQMVTLGLGVGGTLGGGESTVVNDLVDMNGDGLLDRVVQSGSDLSVALNLGYRFAPPESWGQGVLHEGESESQTLSANLGILGFNDGIYGFAGGLSYSQNESTTTKTLLDINGDGLIDRLHWNGSNLMVAVNTGGGFAAETLWGGHLAQGMAVDSNIGLGGGVYFTIGIGPLCLFACYVILNPGADYGEAVSRPEVGLRDVDGDGYVDHIFSDSDSHMTVASNRTGRTNRLKSMTRPLGATAEIEYERSGNTIDQPGSRWVMSRLTVFDGHIGDGADTQVMTYDYQNGFYDRQERDFFGYATVVQADRDTLNGDAVYRTTEYEFHNDSYYTQDKLKRTAVRDSSGALFNETVFTYRLRDVLTHAEPADGSSTTATIFTQPVRTDQVFYEGQAAAGKSTYVTYAYDALGNIIELFEAGDTGPGDDVLAVMAYPYADTACVANYVVGNAISIDVLGNGVAMRHRESTLDCNTGNVLQVREHLANGEIAVTDMAYYGNGNLQRVTRPANQSGQRFQLTYVYDAVAQSYVAQTSDSFGYVSTTTHNYKFGRVLSSSDINGNVLSYGYDAYGRVVSVTGPYDQGGAVPTIRYEYHPHAAVPYGLTHHYDAHRDASGNDTIDTALFIDGLTRVIQTKRDTTLHTGADTPPQDVMVVAGRTLIDAFNRTLAQYHPIVEGLGTVGIFNATYDTVQPTRMDYDVLDRATITTLADNTVIRTDYGFGLDRDGVQQFASTATDANGKQKILYRDVRQQTVAMQEFNNGGSQAIWTTYRYDPLQQLIEVRDDQNHITSMAYDNLGRRTMVNSPDTGQMRYVYDLASNQIAKITANLSAEGKQITYLYDFNRLTQILYPNFPGNNVALTYGGPGAAENRAGRIVTIADQSGSEELFYGNLGEVVKEIKTIASDTQGAVEEVYTTQYSYDTWNRLQTILYPDDELLTYLYDSGGHVHHVSGVKGNDSYPYINRLEYDKFEDRAFIETGNNVRTTFTYDPAMRRLTHLQAGKGDGNPFQNLAYQYDNMGNILGVANNVPASPSNQMGGPTSHAYQYDDLYRLIHAEGAYEYAPNKVNRYVFDQNYDSLHNIVAKQQQHEIVQSSGVAVTQQKTTYSYGYSYTSGRPRAATQVGERTFTYDANGNQIGWTHNNNGTRRDVVFDEENRVQSLSDNGQEQRYKYNYAGERVVKRGPQGEAVYVNAYFSIRNREVGTKHIFVDSVRYASKVMKQGGPNGNGAGQGPQEKDLYFFHADHLGTNQFVTEANGQIYQHIETFPFGETWVDESSNQQRTPYFFTGAELDEETGLYYQGARYYDPRIGSFISTDPLYSEAPEQGILKPNRYALYGYALNNPVRYTDPDGRDAADSLKTPSEFELWFLAWGLNVVFTLNRQGKHKDSEEMGNALVRTTAKYFGIDTSNARSLKYYPGFKGHHGKSEGETTSTRGIKVGPRAFIDPKKHEQGQIEQSIPMLAATILHEAVHTDQIKRHFAAGITFTEDPLLMAIDEVEAYDTVLKHAQTLGLNQGQIDEFKERRQAELKDVRRYGGQDFVDIVENKEYEQAAEFASQRF